MSTQIFCFSGTGNSLAVARDLAEGLKDAELTLVPKVFGQPTKILTDIVGFVFPVYSWGVPRLMVDFLKQLEFSGTEYVFAVVTCGGQPAGTLPQLARLLAKKGVQLQAGFSITQPNNYIIWSGADPEEKQRRLFKEKDDRVSAILEVIKGKKNAPLEQGSKFANFMLGQVYKLAMKNFPKGDKAFWIDEKCNNCGQCERICPRGNIEKENGKRKWQGNCEMCLACIQWCPCEAIQYKKSTANRKRYRHPAVKAAKDLIVR